MMVEMDIFSGQANPTWQLSPDENVELQRKISALEPDANSMNTFDGLGYRGLIVRWPDDPGSWSKVGLGRIEVVQGKKESVYQDQGRTIERWLLSTAKGKISDRLIAAAGL